MVCVLFDIFRRVAGDEALEEQKKRKRWNEKKGRQCTSCNDGTDARESVVTIMAKKELTVLTWQNFQNSTIEVLFRLKATPARRGETWPGFCAGKGEIRVKCGTHAIGAMRGKTRNPCQARENVQPVSSVLKHATGVSRGKLHVSLLGLILIWPLIG